MVLLLINSLLVSGNATIRLYKIITFSLAYSTPYGNRPNRQDRQVVYDDSTGGEDRGSVFNRLGGIGGGGGGPPPAPYVGGAGRPPPKGEESWFKVTVSIDMSPFFHCMRW